MRRLFRHHGLLLASAIAFDTLLSMVPLLALVTVVLSYVVTPERAQVLLAAQVDAVLPGSSRPIIRAYATFLEHRHFVGGFGVAGLVVFGALAFRTAREALGLVFASEPSDLPGVISSVLLPLVYAVLTVFGLIVGSVGLSIIDALPERGATILGWHVELAQASRVGLRLLGFAGLVALFSSLYRLLPEKRVALGHVAIGGIIAGSVWEIVRRILVWYFTHLSLVGVVYGSLTSVVVLLVSLEVGAVVFLVGGQVVAELTRSAAAGVPWHEEPSAS
jgi:YihY family inner membrane protein